MKVLVAELIAAFGESRWKRNMNALVKLLALQAGFVGVYAAMFRAIMLHVEGRQYSWVTSVYWTLTVMSTLGFGDITFHSDIGRLFSIAVLVTGIVMLLIVLPFAFIRFFYAPWLEAQIKLQVPRGVPPETVDHVILCGYDTVAAELMPRLEQLGVPYFVIEPDATVAAELHNEGVPVVLRPLDSRATYEAVRAERARLVFANQDDVHNTNIVLTVREHAPAVTLAALAEDIDSVDVLELAGATTVLALKRQLGEFIGGRADAARVRTHVVGRYRDLLLAEFPVHTTALAGRAIRETRLRELTGLNIVAYWERGKLLPARPDAVLGVYSVLVVAGTEKQVLHLDAMFSIYPANDHPVIIIGGGKVGRSVAATLRERDVRTHLVEKDSRLSADLANEADQVFMGDAADRRVLDDAGISKAPAVALTTNDDATNIFLAVYCRRLNPDVRIVSRITHERNLEAIHRAGADFVLSYSSLGARAILAALRHRELIMLGEGADLFVLETPARLAGVTLAESAIGERTGLNIIALQLGDEVTTNPPATAQLAVGGEIVAIGTTEQLRTFNRTFSD